MPAPPTSRNLTDEQIDAVLDAPSNLGYVIADKRERLRMFARTIADLAVAADREAHSRQEVACLGLLADIRAAVGDPDGRLMQPELLERIRAMALDAQRLQWLIDNGGAVRTRWNGRNNLVYWHSLGDARAEIDAARTAGRKQP